MTAYNFQPQFARSVETGLKRGTIRAPRKDSRLPTVGEDLQLYTGMRHASCRKLCDGICTGVYAIQIYRNELHLDGRVLRRGNAPGDADPFHYEGDLALADGFGSFGDMVAWFAAAHGLPFAGHWIRWEPITKAAAIARAARRKARA